MSMLTGGPDLTVLESEKDLGGYFQRFCKRPEDRKIGLEAEFFGVDRSSGKAVSYEGLGGIEAVLRALAGRFDYETLEERGQVIGLKKPSALIALEPGGQIELSAPPVKTLREIEGQIRDFVAELGALRPLFPEIAWLAAGIQPFSSLGEISWVPKARYGVMAEYLRPRGPLAHWMMKETATNQLNFDYTSETDAMEMLRTALAVTLLASALFANSSFSEGRPNGYLTKRVQIWTQTDPARTGLLLPFFRPGKTFQDYLDYVLEMPMIFIVRSAPAAGCVGDGSATPMADTRGPAFESGVRSAQWIPMKGISFREYLRKGQEGAQATLSDFELHLSTAFPEVRFKQYMEIRGMDAQRPDLIPAMAAFWKGILYDRGARHEVLKLLAFASPEDFQRLHDEVPRRGMQASLAGRPLLPILRDLVRIAREGLRVQRLPGGEDETSYLARLEEAILKPGLSPAEILLEKWRGEFRERPEALIRYLEVPQDSKQV